MAWYNANWLYCMPVTVDNTASATAALAYHQVSVTLSGAAYTSFHAHAKADGSDIVVTDSDGVTPLNFALEGIDNTNSVVYLLVKVPLVAAGATRIIYVYYGNAAATSVSSYPSTVGPATALVGPTDIFTQTDSPNLNNNNVIVRLRYQDQSGGGGAALNGEIQCYINNQATNATVANAVIWQIRSVDGGVTWPTKAAILSPATNYAASVQTVQELANGNILMYYQYDLTANYSPTAKSQTYVARSTNGGRTWSNLSTSPANPMTVPSGYTATGLPYGNAFEATPGGDILKAWYGVKTGNTFMGSYLLRCPSGSDPTVGTNWSLYGTIGYDATHNLSETSVIQTTDANHLIAVMRTDTPTMYQSSSTNGGSVWGATVQLNGPNTAAGSYEAGNYSPWLLKLASGNLLLFAGVRNNAGIASGSIFWTSTDNGANWFDRPGLNPWNYAAALVDTGYPGADQRADGVIVAATYYEIGGNPNTTNIGRITFTEDYAFNAANQYDACESFSAAWTTVPNTTINSAHVHNGSNAIKGDNSSVAMANPLLRVCWPTDPAQLPQGIAFSFWLYDTQNAGNISWSTKPTTVASSRTACYVDGTGATQKVQVNTGAGYVNSTVVAPLNRWNKHTVYANVLASTATTSKSHAGMNNALLSTSPGNVSTFTGSPKSISFQFGNAGATTLTTGWIDDLYTHQFTAFIPVVTAGVEQIPPVVTGMAASLLIGL